MAVCIPVVMFWAVSRVVLSMGINILEEHAFMAEGGNSIILYNMGIQ